MRILFIFSFFLVSSSLYAQRLEFIVGGGVSDHDYRYAIGYITPPDLIKSVYTLNPSFVFTGSINYGTNIYKGVGIILGGGIGIEGVNLKYRDPWDFHEEYLTGQNIFLFSNVLIKYQFKRIQLDFGAIPSLNIKGSGITSRNTGPFILKKFYTNSTIGLTYEFTNIFKLGISTQYNYNVLRRRQVGGVVLTNVNGDIWRVNRYQVHLSFRIPKIKKEKDERKRKKGKKNR